MPQVQETPVISMDDNYATTANNHTALYHPHNNMEEFFISIKKDAEAALALAERLKTDVVKNFVNVIEKCGGTLITSGIGKNFRTFFFFQKQEERRFVKNYKRGNLNSAGQGRGFGTFISVLLFPFLTIQK